MELKLKDILWKFNRLKSMSLFEVLYRFKTQMIVRSLRATKVREYIKKNSPEINYFLCIDELRLDDEYLQFLPNDFVLQLYGANIEITKINWSLDYVDNFAYPKSHVSKISLSDYSDREVKNILEMHRLHFLVDQSVRYFITKDSILFENIIDTIENWIEKNPFPYGMGWVSPTIVSKRLISFLFIWNILNLNNKDGTKKIREKLIGTFNEHIHYVLNTLSLYSSANNHLTAELVGVFSILKSFSSCLTKVGKNVYLKVHKKLEDLIIQQNFSDGKNKECGFGYQYQVTDWFFFAGLLDKKIGPSLFSDTYFLRLKNMFRFFRGAFDNYGNFFDYGDRDNFHVLPFQFESSQSAFIQCLESGAKFFNDPSLIIPRINKGLFDFRNRILFGRNFSVEKRCKKHSQTKYYEKGGHIVSWFQDNLGNDIYFNFRSGSFGYLSIAAHSHSDLNSFFLSINGQPVFIDPGTYCYRKDPLFRNYFRSALAHNTISVNSQDHALKFGFNHWHNKAEIKGEIFDYFNNKKQLSFKSGCKFPDGTKHIRYILLEKDIFELKIIDRIFAGKNKGGVNIIFSLQLYPNLNFENNKINLEDGNKLVIKSDYDLKAFYGQKEPFISGWYSPEFSKIEKTVSLRGIVKDREQLITTFTLGK
ncbi:alginate lyase family protein [Thermophagus sp. OGC60D27]|uniref:alginate lyase family protein n=1 Tax=Thermophagus sp. OGC60D27 TaxID=3458415 RepID=UPI004038174D